MSNLSFKDLREKNNKRAIEWTGNIPRIEDLLFTAVELGGEAGEVLNAVKKFHRWRAGILGGVGEIESLAAIASELADVVICADRVAAALDIDLGQAVKEKFNRTSEKYCLKTVFNERAPVVTCQCGSPVPVVPGDRPGEYRCQCGRRYTFSSRLFHENGETFIAFSMQRIDSL